jgi:hypothetical protein
MRMTTIILATAAALVSGLTDAMARGGGGVDIGGHIVETQSGYAKDPVGNRQLSQEYLRGLNALADLIGRENALLDRKLQGICRGC